MEKRLGLTTLFAFVLSIVCGLLIPQFADDVAFAGTIYMNLLKMIIIPVLFFSITSALANYSSRGLGKTTLKTILLFAAMYIFSFLICMLLWVIIQPGVGFSIIEIPWEGSIVHASLDEFLISLFPPNIFQAISENALLPTIIFSFAFGFALARTRPYGSKSFNNLNRIVSGVLHYILYVTPFGVFSLMYGTVAEFGNKIFASAVTYIIAAYFGCVVIAFFVMILPVWVYAKINPIKYLKKIYKILVITISTCSSAATLPTTIKICNEEFGVSERITDLVVPLGCTIHMCGGAVSFSLLAMFNMQMMNIPITLGAFLIMLFVALLLNMGAPGIPGGGIVIGASFLSILGIPLTFIGLYAGIYRVLDMAYTTMNVWGDITANILINHGEIRKQLKQQV